MLHVLALGSFVNLLVGVALLLAWRREPELRFSLYLGVSFLCQVLTPPGFALWQSPSLPAHQAGVVILAVAGVASLGALAAGCAGLASRPLGRAGWVMLGLFALATIGLLGRGMQPPLLLSSLLHVGLGLVASHWLRGRSPAERLAGPLIVALGMVQLITVTGGVELAVWQLVAASVVRLALGLCLLEAALHLSSERALRARQRFVQLVERSHQGVGVQRGEQLLYMNPAAQRIYGVDDVSQVAQRWRDASIPAADLEAARERHRALMSGELEHVEWEADRRRMDGTPLRLRFSAWRIDDWDGGPAEQVVVTDITLEHNALRERLHQATHDVLTGLPNRAALMHALRELTPAGRRFALVVIDIDRFALINEAHSASVGDEVLRELARRLQGRFVDQARLTRLGEDEFALLVEDADPPAAAMQLIEGVRAVLEQPVPAAGQAFHLDASMGVSYHPGTATDPERLLRSATAAMHEAKKVPGSSVQVAEERFERGSGRSLAAEQALRGGIARQEFFLAYQPKVDAVDGKLLGFEALVRWRHDGRTVSPADFVPAAERTGLIGALGRLVLAEACRQLASWRSAGLETVPVAINVSRWQLRDPDFAAQVRAELQACGLEPGAIVIEVTETSAMNDLDAVRAQVMALHEAGIALSLDDFGSGLSSLTTLRTLPLREVKLDRGLVEPLPMADAAAVVRAICDLARALDLAVVAEGVETAAQADCAVACGCQAVQGYWLARPLMPDVATAWLRAGRQPVAA